MDRLVIDTRWRGKHGIARYSSEVIPRLELGWSPLNATARPGSPRDLISPRLVPPGSTIYSPGYNAGVASAKQILTVHDLIHLERNSAKYRHYYERVLRPVVRRAGLLLTVSETSRTALREWLRDDSVRILNAGNGCSEAFSPDSQAPRAGAEPYVLYVGNLKRHKNVEVLLRTLRALDGVRLIAVTPDPQGLERLADALGLGQRVTSMSGIDDEALCGLYRSASATVLPSTIEGFGLPALESIRSGTAVIYWAGCASVAEIVRDNGIAVESATDEEEWADAIRQLLDRPIQVPDDAAAEYSWSDVARRVQAALQDDRTRSE